EVVRVVPAGAQHERGHLAAVSRLADQDHGLLLVQLPRLRAGHDVVQRDQDGALDAPFLPLPRLPDVDHLVVVLGFVERPNVIHLRIRPPGSKLAKALGSSTWRVASRWTRGTPKGTPSPGSPGPERRFAVWPSTSRRSGSRARSAS